MDVGVPAGVHQAVLVPADRDELAARFQEPSRREARLSKQRHAVLLSHLRRLALHVEGVAKLPRSQHRAGQSAVPGERGSLVLPSAPRRAESS